MEFIETPTFGQIQRYLNQIDFCLRISVINIFIHISHLVLDDETVLVSHIFYYIFLYIFNIIVNFLYFYILYFYYILLNSWTDCNIYWITGQRYALLEMQALVAVLIHNFYVEPVDTLKNLRLQVDMLLTPTKPLRARFIPIYNK